MITQHIYNEMLEKFIDGGYIDNNFIDIKAIYNLFFSQYAEYIE